MTATVNIIAILIVLVGIADVVTTKSALARGAVETNPVIRWMMSKFGGGWVVWKILFHFIVAVIYVLAATLWWAVASIMAAVFIVIIAIVSVMNHGASR
jgi:hypothetical protein